MGGSLDENGMYWCVSELNVQCEREVFMIHTVAAHEFLMPLTVVGPIDLWARSKIICFVDTLTRAEKIVYGRNLCPRGVLPTSPDIPILKVELDFDSAEERHMMHFLRSLKHPWQKWR